MLDASALTNTPSISACIQQSEQQLITAAAQHVLAIADGVDIHWRCTTKASGS
jgi:hypothetical protein